MLEWVHRRLDEDEDVIVPLRRLWNEWYAVAGEPPFDTFARSVLGDGRFECVYSLNDNPHLEAWGYFPGPRVKLRSREVTEECVLHLVRKYNEDLVRALRRAWEILQDDTEPHSGDLGEAILILEEVKPALTPWVHLRPSRHREGSRG
jgi:hypothetical protein